MENLTITIEICPAHEEKLAEIATFFGYEQIDELLSHMLAQELHRAEEKMLAELFRMHHEELRAIIKNRSGDLH